MIWDAVILRIPDDRRHATVLANEDILPMGTIASVKSVVRAAFPDAKWLFPDCAEHQLDADTAVRIDLGYVENSKSLHIAVTGPGNPLAALLPIAHAQGWVVLDLSSRTFIDPLSPENPGFAGYPVLWEQIQKRLAASEG